MNRTITVVFKFVPLRLGVDEAGTELVTRTLGLPLGVGVTMAIVRKVRMLFWAAVGVAFLALVSAPASLPQWAQTALAQGETGVKEMLVRLKENRDFCLRALSEIRGVPVPSPDGAFYLFPKIEGLKDAFDFCIRLLRETKVGIAPGVAFGAGGEGSVRICYAAERPILELVSG